MDPNAMVIDPALSGLALPTTGPARPAARVIAPPPVAGPSSAGMFIPRTSGRATKPTRYRSETPGLQDDAARTTRSSLRSKVAPKLKFKISDKANAALPNQSFLGPFDRELDSDEEDLAFEEQFILRMPPGEDCDKLRKVVASREAPNDVWFKFKDSRRAVFHIGKNSYASKLVDLPCILESNKTLDNKQMFKVADICQMLVVEKKIESEDAVTGGQKNVNVDEFIWPHGVTPPLAHVRKRRFRRRVNKRTIESVEQEVERLLDEDANATEVKFDILENVDPALSDSEFIEREDGDGPMDAPTPGGAPSDVGDAPTPGADFAENEDEEEEEDGLDDEIDKELAAELDLALGDDEDEEEEEEEEDESEEESDDEDDEASQSRKLLNEEIRDLEAAVAKKGKEIESSGNPLIRKRFEALLQKLTADLEMKLAQRDDMKEKARMEKEGITAEPDQEEEMDMDELEAEINGMGMNPAVPGGIDPQLMPPMPMPMPPPHLGNMGPGIGVTPAAPEEGEESDDGDLFGPEDEMDVS